MRYTGLWWLLQDLVRPYLELVVTTQLEIGIFGQMSMITGGPVRFWMLLIITICKCRRQSQLRDCMELSRLMQKGTLRSGQDVAFVTCRCIPPICHGLRQTQSDCKHCPMNVPS